MMWKCEYCGRLWSDNDLDCGSCGAPRSINSGWVNMPPVMISTKPRTRKPVIMGRGPIVPMNALDMTIKAADVRKRIEELEQA